MAWDAKEVGEVCETIGNVEPPTDQAYRFIELSAGKSFAGGYNEGVITSEAVSGSYPNITATGVISDASSPFIGQVVEFTSTEFASSIRYFARIR
ncbi:hypothetical protein [Rhizobium lentis]|uniref:hypothetical protein n=1 Tax=Rhizobium lentis TaxID=1138194 RepID=UPI001C8313C1|nr:hypothetical protein [Rhizobium lentis]MBX5112675.1 hypothetical protein [Rhizobium lentis]